MASMSLLPLQAARSPLRVARSEGRVDSSHSPTGNMDRSLSATVRRRITIIDTCELRIGTQGTWAVALYSVFVSVV